MSYLYLKFQLTLYIHQLGTFGATSFFTFDNEKKFTIQLKLTYIKKIRLKMKLPHNEIYLLLFKYITLKLILIHFIQK
jgi:hypothetical protein